MNTPQLHHAVPLGLTGGAWQKGGTGGCADAVIE
jgi:hypothetical protein